MVVGDQTPKAALRRTKRVIAGHPSTGPDDVFPFRVYSNDSLVTVDRDELQLIFDDYERLQAKAGIEVDWRSSLHRTDLSK